jgi:hypothetical protein
VFTDYTRQAALTHSGFEQRLRQKLAALVAAREDVLLQAKVMATVGIQTQAFVAGAQANQVLIGTAKVESAVGVAPDVALVNRPTSVCCSARVSPSPRPVSSPSWTCSCGGCGWMRPRRRPPGSFWSVPGGRRPPVEAVQRARLRGRGVPPWSVRRALGESARAGRRRLIGVNRGVHR